MSRPAEARRLSPCDPGAVHGSRVRLGGCRLTVPVEVPCRSAARGYVGVGDASAREAEAMSRPAEARRLISYEYGAVHGPRVRLGDCRLTVPEEMPRRSAARGYVDVFDSRDQEADQ